MEAYLLRVYEAVINGDKNQVMEGVKAALELASPETILYEVMIPAMDVVGELYEKGEYYIPEMLVSAHAMRAGVDVLKPLLKARDVDLTVKIAIGTVQGDLHDIGKNLTAMMLEGAGFQVVDLGIDVSPEKYIDAAKNGAKVLGLSALLTTTMPQMKVVIDELAKAGIRDQVKVIIGGAPITQAYATSIGADGYAPDARGAVNLVRALTAQEAP
jgi:5-methyltetrahydrofolate--homocysteine methyltransferase